MNDFSQLEGFKESIEINFRKEDGTIIWSEEIAGSILNPKSFINQTAEALGRLQYWLESQDAKAEFAEDLQDADDHITEMTREDEMKIFGVDK